jgi:hypothetical protein
MQIDTDTARCPFCGVVDVTTELDREQGTKWGFAVCGGCAARGPEVRTEYAKENDAPWRADALAAWNTRAPIPTDTLRKALEAAVSLQMVLGCLEQANDGAWMEYDRGEIVRIDGDVSIAKLRAAILSTIDLDALAAKLGGGE